MDEWCDLDDITTASAFYLDLLHKLIDQAPSGEKTRRYSPGHHMVIILPADQRRNLCNPQRPGKRLHQGLAPPQP